MKSWTVRKRAGVMVAGLLLAELQTVWAQRPPPVSPFDGGSPAAPEPKLIAMLAIGLALVAGYVIYRVRKNKTK